MSDLRRIDQLKFEKLFSMDSGYVMDFSNRTFDDFVLKSTHKDISLPKYTENGDSKARRLRAFWNLEPNAVVGKLTIDMLEYWKAKKLLDGAEITEPEERLYEDALQVAQRLKQDSVVGEIEVIRELDDANFDVLAQAIKNSIEQNQPELALDRLHTYLVKYVRQLCEKHNLPFGPKEPLNSLFGKYNNFLNRENKIESEMTKGILKTSVQNLEAFNDIRNNRSFAHDNEIINYAESVLICNNIVNLIKFVQQMEEGMEEEPMQPDNIDDLPF